MKRTELENGIAKQLSSVILREDEMVENIMQMVDAHVNKQLLLHNVSKRFSSAKKMAEWLHNNYEEIALNNGWKTQEDCQVPFCDLPKKNKQTMIEVCERFLNVC